MFADGLTIKMFADLSLARIAQRLLIFPRAKEHSSRSANNEGVLLGWAEVVFTPRESFTPRVNEVKGKAVDLG